VCLQADKNQLAELRQYQQRVRLSDDVAVDIVKEAARTQLEAALDAAVEVTNRRTRQRDNTDAIAQALHCFVALPLPGTLLLFGLLHSLITCFLIRGPQMLHFT
jgi:uncharacterized protein YybS (DUF2232 family)